MIRDIQNIDDDVIKAKRLIKEKLYSDPDIIEALHNPELDPEEPDQYVGVNIFDYIRIPGTVDKVKNFICFDVKQERNSYTNDHMKLQKYIFMVFCHEDDIDTGYGISRHDLLSYLIRDIFNFSNIMGTQLVIASNIPNLTEKCFSSRTITFEEYTLNSLQRGVKTNKYEFPR